MTDAMKAVLAVLAGKRFSLEDEKRTQTEMWSVLEADPRTWQGGREVRVAGGIIDFLIGGAGIEVKLKGQPAAIARQLKGYAAEPAIEGLVLVTARPVALGARIGGKPVAVFDLARAWL